MANVLNQCNFIGRLGADPETRYASSGDAICNFRIAVGWKTKEKEGAEWVRVSTFGKLAEICGKYLKKGSQVFISGKMNTRKWQDKEGRDQYTTEIRADQMQMLGGAREGGADAGSGHESGGKQQERRATAPEKNPAHGDFDEFDDDVPF